MLRETVCSVVRAAGAGVGGGPCWRVEVATADQKEVLRRESTPSFSFCAVGADCLPIEVMEGVAGEKVCLEEYWWG